MNKPVYTITNDSITIIWDSQLHTIPRGAPQFVNLKKAIMEEDWASVPLHLTIESSLEAWSSGRITVKQGAMYYDSTALPHDIGNRIREMTRRGENPQPLINFWERLQRNPSFRSVKQLWGFLQHQNIPLTPKGCFLAYKAVNRNYTDKHSGLIDNSPGVVNRMPRNQISDDPELACHDGFHVGALDYARQFGGGFGRMIICEIDPEHVVCVPRDESQMKMRVCEYTVIGNYGEPLPSTVFEEEEGTITEEELNLQYLAFEEDMEELEAQKAQEGKEPEQEPEKPKAEEAPKEKKENALLYTWEKIDKLDYGDLLKLPIEVLRKYATYGLKIVGASKIQGGKVTLIARILEVRKDR